MGVFGMEDIDEEPHEFSILPAGKGHESRSVMPGPIERAQKDDDHEKREGDGTEAFVGLLRPCNDLADIVGQRFK
jgi:hypothetical protein